MYAVGITSSDIPGPLHPPSKDFELQRKDWSHRIWGYDRSTRLAAVLYKAHQTQEGHWIWRKTDVIAETTYSRKRAKQDAYTLAAKFGNCRVYLFGIGFRRIGADDERTYKEQRKQERARWMARRRWLSRCAK